MSGSDEFVAEHDPQLLSTIMRKVLDDFAICCVWRGRT
jgi:hypothetical protein